MKMFIMLAEHLGHLLRQAKVVRINNRIEIVTSFKDADKIVEYLKTLFQIKTSDS